MALVAALWAMRAVAQVPADPRVSEFEVASIKPTKFEPGPTGVMFLTGGRVSVRNDNLLHIIQSAYGLRPQQVSGARELGTMLNELYNIDAKAASDATSGEQARLMLQSLLTTRFKLQAHHEARDVPVYALTVEKSGAKLQSAPERDCSGTPSPCHRVSGGPGGGLSGKTVTVAEFANVLSVFVERPVMDRTAITGNFDIDLPPWSRLAQSNPVSDERERIPDPASAPVFTALQERLGLELEPTKSSLDVLVIDHIERPSED
jgi:uncharacterized protein (TIGR03435 family)